MKTSTLSRCRRALLAAIAFLGAVVARGAEELEVESRSIDAAETEAALAVRATTRAGPIQGYVLAVRFVPAELALARFALAGNWVGQASPDFVSAASGEPGSAALAVVLDLVDDGIVKVVPADPGGELQEIARLELHIPGSNPGPYRVELEDRSVRSAAGLLFTNSLVISGQDFFAESPDQPLVLRSGSLRRSSGPRFVRGDVNPSGVIDLTDPIRILNYLFTGGLEPECLDAADVDDSGGDRPGITDAIRLLDWLFRGGPAPAFPAPATAAYLAADCGEDLTGDGMDCRIPPETCRR